MHRFKRTTDSDGMAGAAAGRSARKHGLSPTDSATLSSLPLTKKSDPLTKHGPWFTAVLLVELALAVGLPADVPDRLPLLAAFTQFVEGFAPIIGRFDQTAREPQVVRTFLLITFLLAPFKIAYWLIWLHSDYLARYRDYVVSPLTPDQPKKTYGLIGPQPGQPQESRPRSMVSRIVWSLAALTLCIGFWWLTIYEFGDPSFRERRGTFRGVLHAIRAGDLRMWFGWSVLYVSVGLSSTGAIAICIVRDYIVFFRNQFRRVLKRRGEGDE